MKRICTRTIFLLFTILTCVNVHAKAVDLLSNEDREIYSDTVSKCKTGSVTDALKIGLNHKVALSATINLTNIAMLDASASNIRANSSFMSPELYRLRNSNGFWLALAECFGDKSVKWYMAKQLVDFGHLGSEVGGSFLSFFTILKSSAAMLKLNKTKPRLSRFLLYSGATISLSDAYFNIKREYFDVPTSEEEDLMSEIEQELFKGKDVTVKKVVLLINRKLKEIDNQLKDANLSNDERVALRLKRDKILIDLKNLEQRIKS